MDPREAFARGIDWCNVRAVEWWIGGRAPVRPSAEAVPVEPPSGEPRCVGSTGRRETWAAPGSDWTAERRTPAGDDARDVAVVLLHGWLAGPLQFSYYRWVTSPLLRFAEVWTPRLPEHGVRASAGARSGELCLSDDLELSAAQVSRAVAETRWLLHWLRGRHRRVLLWGVSLGGWVAALSSRGGAVDGLVLWAPVLDPPRTLTESALGGVIGSRLDGAARDRGLESERFRRLTPLEASDDWAGISTLIVGGRFDDIAPPDSLERAARRSSAELLILPHGHISLLASPRGRRRTLGFVRSVAADTRGDSGSSSPKDGEGRTVRNALAG